MRKLKIIFIMLLLSAFILPVFKPLRDYGFYPIHDDMQFQRLTEMRDALVAGSFPVRMVKNLGYGYHYPLYNFYAPLPYYIGAFLNLIGFDVLASTKLMFILPNLLSIFAMFFLAKKVCENFLISFLAAILYAYFPYRAVDNYVRGVIGEIYVMAFVPLLILGLVDKIKTGKISWLFVFSLAGIILSHNIYAYLVCFYLAVSLGLYILFSRRDKKTLIIFFLKNIAFVIGLTCFFWLPALLEAKFTHLSILNQEGYYFGNYFINIGDLWQSEWGYGGAAGGLTFMIGKIHLTLGAIGLILILFIGKNMNREKLLLRFILIIGFCFSVLMTNQISNFLWLSIPGISLTQYPMRFIFFIDLYLIMFVLLVFTDFLKIVSGLRKKAFLLFLILLTVLIPFKNAKFFKSKYNYEFSEEVLKPSYIKWVSSEMSDEYLPQEFELPIAKDEVSKDSIIGFSQIRYRILNHKADDFEVQIENSKDNNLVTFPITDFPGWQVYLNGRQIEHQRKTKLFLISVFLPKGSHKVRIVFQNTPIRSIANITSLLTFGLTVFFFGREIAKKQNG